VSLSTHVLDAVAGRPATALGLHLRHLSGAGREVTGRTDGDGRCRLVEDDLPAGTYRLVFATGEWFAAQGVPTFYPEVAVTFTVTDPAAHLHVPLLLSPYAYSTYRGS
jgi:5-hydroxyisourate hydrolase